MPLWGVAVVVNYFVDDAHIIGELDPKVKAISGLFFTFSLGWVSACRAVTYDMLIRTVSLVSCSGRSPAPCINEQAPLSRRSIVLSGCRAGVDHAAASAGAGSEDVVRAAFFEAFFFTTFFFAAFSRLP